MSKLASRRLAGIVVPERSGTSGLSFKAHDPVWDREVRAPVELGGEHSRRMLYEAGATPAIATFDRNGRLDDLELPAA